MDGLDWSKFQHQELPQNLIIPTTSISSSDDFISVQQIHSSPTNLFPQWSPLDSPFQYYGPIPHDSGPPSPPPRLNLDPHAATASFDSVDDQDGISLIFTNTTLNTTNTISNTSINFKPVQGISEKIPIVDNHIKRKRTAQKPKRPIPEKPQPTNINFHRPSSSADASSSADEPDAEAIAHMKEIIYRAAAFRPVEFGAAEEAKRPRRKNVRISNDPQTVAARQRREKISERIRVLQRLVPGGSKMDTASMLDEAANYLKFLRSQVKALEALGGQKIIDHHPTVHGVDYGFAYSSPCYNYPFAAAMQQPQFSIQGPNPVSKPGSR